jgi:hypothetical protein
MTVRRSVYQALDAKELRQYKKFVEDSSNTEFTEFDFEELRCYMTFQDVQTADDYCSQLMAIFYKSWNTLVTRNTYA